MSSTLIQPKTTHISKARIKLLTPQQQLFIQALLADPTFNTAKAAKAAGYSQGAAAANKLLHQPVIRAAIGNALRKRLDKLELTAEEVISQLTSVLRIRPIDVFEVDEDGSLTVKNPNDIPDDIQRCISKVEVKSKTIELEDGSKTTSQYIKVELMSKDAALPLAMKHFGIAGADSPGSVVNVNVEIALAQLLSAMEGGANVVEGKLIEDKSSTLPPTNGNSQ